MQICILFFLGTLSAPANAQSFFTQLVTDPTVGVDRGSASNIQKLDRPTTFLTFDTYGADDIGPYIAGAGYVLPDAFAGGDQLDFVGVIAGPSQDDQTELLAGGIAYRFPIQVGQTYLFLNADYSDFRLGTATNLALQAEGDRSNISFGLRHQKALSDDAKLTSTLELIGRQSSGEVLGFPVLDEKLRLIRASVLYEKGIPFFFQKRFSASVTKGFDDFGASDQLNLLASAPGASSDFLRASFSAETSVPLSRKVVINAGVIGQWTNDSLPISQRCGYGTNAYARGFDQSFVNGDQCLGGRVELAYNLQLPVQGSETIRFTQSYFGIDAGWTEDNANVFLPKHSDQWSSASLGIRTIQGNIIAELALTHILDEPVGIVAQDDTRLWFRAGIRF